MPKTSAPPESRVTPFLSGDPVQLTAALLHQREAERLRTEAKGRLDAIADIKGFIRLIRSNITDPLGVLEHHLTNLEFAAKLAQENA